MRISELADRTGVSIPVLKLYIREGLLARGAPTSATQAEYGPEHLDRVNLVQALRRVQEMPLARIREILDLIDAPPADVVTATGRAVGALPPYVPQPADLGDARRVVEHLGMRFAPERPATAQLQTSIEALAAAGLPVDAETLDRYAAPLWGTAEAELVPMQGMATPDAVAYAVLGTALYEPLILALRRLMHQHLLSPEDAPSGPDAGGGTDVLAADAAARADGGEPERS